MPVTHQLNKSFQISQYDYNKVIDQVEIYKSLGWKFVSICESKPFFFVNLYWDSDSEPVFPK